jgi:hypothetical protein
MVVESTEIRASGRIKIGNLTLGEKGPLFLISGPVS